MLTYISDLAVEIVRNLSTTDRSDIEFLGISLEKGQYLCLAHIDDVISNLNPRSSRWYSISLIVWTNFSIAKFVSNVRILCFKKKSFFLSLGGFVSHLGKKREK